MSPAECIAIRNWSMTPPSIFNGLPIHQGFYLVTELDDCKLDAIHEKLSVFTFPLLRYEASAIGLICKLLDFQGQGLAYGMSWCDSMDSEVCMHINYSVWDHSQQSLDINITESKTFLIELLLTLAYPGEQNVAGSI